MTKSAFSRRDLLRHHARTDALPVRRDEPRRRFGGRRYLSNIDLTARPARAHTAVELIDATRLDIHLPAQLLQLLLEPLLADFVGVDAGGEAQCERTEPGG